MNSKIIVVTIALLGISSILFAQDSKYQRLALFDRANFIERLKEFNISNMDTLEIIQGEAVVKDEKTNKPLWTGSTIVFIETESLFLFNNET